MEFLVAVITLGGIFALMTLALNIQMGYAGLINFGIVAYFCVGAYAYAVFTQDPPTEFDRYLFGLGLPPVVGVIAAIVAAVLFAALTGWPALRLRGEYLALTTFAFAEVFGTLVTNTSGITNGTLGLLGLQQPLSDHVNPARYPLLLAALIGVLVIAMFLLAQRIGNAPFGRSLFAIQDDEIAALQAGKGVRSMRLQAFLLGAGISGLAGACYVWYITVVNPQMFTAEVTFTIFIALILGGIRSNRGAVLGAFILIGFQEAMRFLAANPIIGERTAAVQSVAEGLVLVLLLRFAPGGVMEIARRVREATGKTDEEAPTPENGRTSTIKNNLAREA